MIAVKHRISCLVRAEVIDLGLIHQASVRVWHEADLYGYHGDPPKLELDPQTKAVLVSLEWEVLG